jgi:hypothetical protein
MAFAKITEDILHDDDHDAWDSMNVQSKKGTVIFDSTPESGDEIPFRLLDDDRVPYYVGVCTGDDEALARVLSWGMGDSGATILQCKDHQDSWVDYMN